MSKNSQAAKAVPEPQGTINLRASLSTLSQARQVVTDAISATAKAVLAMPHEELQALGDRFLRPVLTEVARARENKAVLAVVRAMQDMTHINLTEEEAKNVIGVGYNLPAEAFLSDGKNTNLTALLIAAIRKISNDDSVGPAVHALISAKVRTNPFLDAVLASSSLHFSDKLEVLDMSDGALELREETMRALETQLLRWLDNNSHTNGAVTNVRKAVGTEERNTNREQAQEMVLRLASYRECEHAPVVAEAVPESFDTVCGEVLRSGSPSAMASFWRKHSAKCNKKAFLEKLTEAVQPDPAALAEAILDNKRYGGRHGYPMMIHPMMDPWPMFVRSHGRRW